MGFYDKINYTIVVDKDNEQTFYVSSLTPQWQ